MNIKRLVLYGFLGALLYVGQVALAFLPNVEVVSVLLIVYTIYFGVEALFPLYTFVLLEGITYGFGMWVLTYMYIWLVLFFLAKIFKKQTNPLFWAILNGFYGLSFGFLCTILWVAFYGINSGIAWFISGIPFDIIHCIGNFFTALILFKPLCHIMSFIRNHISQ